jgi:bacteriocin biosynthesis cyclodehydratase domain-containing protein
MPADHAYVDWPFALADGPFGSSTLHYLRLLRREITVSDSSIHNLQRLLRPSEWSICILASSSPSFAVCAWLDEYCHQSKKAFIPLTVEGIILRLGPIVIPGSGSCWHCAQTRRFQQQDHGSEWYSLRDSSNQLLDPAPLGFLEPFALLAAGQIDQAIYAITSHQPVAGKIWQMNMLTTEVRSGVAIGVDNCPRCGLKRDTLGRSTELIQAHCARLWSNFGGED